jgi:hypothetical protein
LSAPALPNKVIFAPDLIGAAFIDPHARRVLEHWREGAFKIVMNRELLILHLKVLSQVGLSSELIHRWSLWLTAPDKSFFSSEPNGSGSSASAICRSLAEKSESSKIVCSRGLPGELGAFWISPAEFLRYQETDR